MENDELKRNYNSNLHEQKSRDIFSENQQKYDMSNLEKSMISGKLLKSMYPQIDEPQPA